MTRWDKVSNQFFTGDEVIVRVRPKKGQSRKAAKAVEALLNYYIRHHAAEFFRDVLTTYNIDQSVYGTGNVDIDQTGKVKKRKDSYGGTI